MSTNGPKSKNSADVFAWVREVAPELAAAVTDVDVTQLESMDRRTPLQRLQDASSVSTELERLKALPRRSWRI